MMRWALRLGALAAAVALGLWIWSIFFPSTEHVIRKRLAEVAHAASFSAKDGPLAQALNPEHLVGFFSADVKVIVDVPGQVLQNINGRDELLQRAALARAALTSLKIEFLDISVTLAPDKQFAFANLTARANLPGEREPSVQEMKFTFKRIAGEWLIIRVETVKTLL
jgi:ketosteroid isomerase-like protein